jgi:hypothetical protein
MTNDKLHTKETKKLEKTCEKMSPGRFLNYFLEQKTRTRVWMKILEEFCSAIIVTVLIGPNR